MILMTLCLINSVRRPLAPPVFPIRSLKITLVDDNNEKFCKFVGTLFLISNSQKLRHREIEVIFERHFILESRSIAGYVTVRENGMTKKNEIYRARFRELHYIV